MWNFDGYSEDAWINAYYFYRCPFCGSTFWQKELGNGVIYCDVCKRYNNRDGPRPHYSPIPYPRVFDYYGSKEYVRISKPF